MTAPQGKLTFHPPNLATVCHWTASVPWLLTKFTYFSGMLDACPQIWSPASTLLNLLTRQDPNLCPFILLTIILPNTRRREGREWTSLLSSGKSIATRDHDFSCTDRGWSSRFLARECQLVACFAFASVVTSSILTKVGCFFRAREEPRVPLFAVGWAIKPWHPMMHAMLPARLA